MSERDLWARLTPYEIGIPGRAFADRAFAEIREEAESRGTDLMDPGAFILLGQVGLRIREIQGDERGGDVIHRFGAFLFHAFHFHGAGEPLYLLGESIARELLARSFESSSWSGELPAEAGYLQLPRHLFWSSPGMDDHAEPLDGVFWVRSFGETLSLLVALGVRSDRPGISVTELPPVALSNARTWLTDKVRAEGGDFSTTLPGGELDQLYSIGTLGEVLKLVGRSFAYLSGAPKALGPEEAAPRPQELEVAAGSPTPSLLPFRRIGVATEPHGEPRSGEENDP